MKSLILAVVLVLAPWSAWAAENQTPVPEELREFEKISLTEQDAKAVAKACTELQQSLGDMQKIRQEAANEGAPLPSFTILLEAMLKTEIAKFRMRLTLKHARAVVKAPATDEGEAALKREFRFRVRHGTDNWSIIEER